ncbi:hypothetical protein ACFQU2_12880 [Siccirubricoccus deserti]
MELPRDILRLSRAEGWQGGEDGKGAKVAAEPGIDGKGKGAGGIRHPGVKAAR